MGEHRFKIMVVEDDESTRRCMAEALEAWGFEVSSPDPRNDVLSAFGAASPHLLILDVGLPRLDGYEWCSRVREHSKIPILFVSARSSPGDQVRALLGGGDDWLAKPFELEVLLARVRTLLRRSYYWAAELGRFLERRGLVFDLDRNSVSRDGAKAGLSKNEGALLRRLLEADGRIVSREFLMDALWSEECFVDDNTLTVNVTRLKKTLASLGAEGFVETVRGLGYRIP